jgi:beta-aspartyl-peptidase (threonine type)
VKAKNSAEPGRFSLVIHGGSGVMTRAEFDREPALEQAYRDTLAAALTAGYQVLAAGGSAVEAVEAAIRVLEDSLFQCRQGRELRGGRHRGLDGDHGGKP